jgi:protein AroM
MVSVAFVTIGQSPRDDIMPDIRRGLPSRFEIEQVGALDAFDSQCEIEAVAGSEEGEPIMVTRLRDGSSARVSRQGIAEQIQRVITDIEDDVDVIGVLCTGDFPHFDAAVPVVDPGHLLYAWASAIAPDDTIGVLMPDAEQEPQVREKWAGLDIVPTVGSPYEHEDDLRAAARSLAGDVDMFVLDCMGSTARMKEAVRTETDTSVLLPNSILTKTLTELF